MFFVFLVACAVGCKTSKGWLGEGVLAVAGPDKVTVDDLMASVDGNLPASPAQREQLLMNIVNNKLVAMQSHSEGLVVGDDVYSQVDAADIEQLSKMLAIDVADKTAVSDEELEVYRLKDSVTELRVKMLVARTIDGAETALAELESGKSFEEVAEEHPKLFAEAMRQDRFIMMDDDLYPFGVRAALNQLKPGDLSPIMKLQVGYGIFRLESRRGPEERWSAMKDEVAKKVKNEKAEREMEELEARLRSQADIAIEQTPDGFRATVDGKTITQRMPAAGEDRRDPHEPHSGMNPATLRTALNSIISKLLLANEARRRGLDKTPAFMRIQKLEMEKIIAGQYIENIKKDITVTPQDLKDYYENNKENLASQELVKVSRILLKDKGEAEAVEARLRSGADFAETARQYSEDAESAKRGGDVGWVQNSKLRQPLRDVLYELNVGDVSKVVETPYGFEILMALERKPSVVPEFADVEETIAKRVELNKRADIVNSLYDRLFKKMKVKVDLELLHSL